SDRLIHAGRANSKTIDHRANEAGLSVAAHETTLRELPQDGQGEVLPHGQRQQESLSFAVLRQKRYTPTNRFAWVAYMCTLTLDFYCSAPDSIDAEEREQQFTLPLTCQPADTEHFATIRCE